MSRESADRERTCLNCGKTSRKGRLGPAGSGYAGKFYCDQCWADWDKVHWTGSGVHRAQPSQRRAAPKSESVQKSLPASASSVAAPRAPPQGKDTLIAAAFWGILDIKYDSRKPAGRRVCVLELGDGSTSGFSQHGQAISDNYKRRYCPDSRPLRCAVLVENKKLTHDRFVNEGFKHLRPEAGCYAKRYSPDLAARIVADLHLTTSSTGMVVLKLCNRSHGAGVVIVPVARLDNVLRMLLLPPDGEELVAWMQRETPSVLRSDGLDVLEENRRHWWSNECPSFLAERYCHSVPVSGATKSQQFDGTMRVSFVIQRVKMDATKKNGQAATQSPNTVEWLGGYWKLPRAAMTTSDSLAINESTSLDDIHSQLISSFKSGDKLTAEVSLEFLDDVYAELTPAVQRVFAASVNDRVVDPERILQDYSVSNPLFGAFVLTRIASSVRNRKMDEARHLISLAGGMISPGKAGADKELTNGNSKKSLAERAVLSYIQRITAILDFMPFMERSRRPNGEQASDPTAGEEEAMKKKAEQAIETSIRSFPTNSTAYYIKGLIHVADQGFHAAASCMLKSIMLDPCFKEPYLVLSSCLLQQGKFDEALEAGKACLGQFSSPTAHFYVGQALYQKAWDQRAVLPEEELVEMCKTGAASLQICKEQVPQGWERRTEDMLQYMLAGSEERGKFSKQEVVIWQVAGLRP